MSEVNEIQLPDEPIADEVIQISELLEGKGESPESADTPEKDEVISEQEPAEKAELDYGQQVPMTDGTTKTLGELKDAWQAQSSHLLEISDREEAISRSREEVNTLLQYMGQLPPEAVEHAKIQAKADYEREMQTLIDIIPETKSVGGAKEVKLALYKLAGEYGVPPQEVDQIKSAVTIKMMHDFAKLRASIRDAKANVKPIRSASTNGTNAPSNQSDVQALTAKAKSTHSGTDEAKAIHALLRSNSR